MYMKEQVLCLYSQALYGTQTVLGTRCSWAEEDRLTWGGEERDGEGTTLQNKAGAVLLVDANTLC